jgi:hypothetical protein
VVAMLRRLKLVDAEATQYVGPTLASVDDGQGRSVPWATMLVNTEASWDRPWRRLMQAKGRSVSWRRWCWLGPTLAKVDVGQGR